MSSAYHNFEVILLLEKKGTDTMCGTNGRK